LSTVAVHPQPIGPVRAGLRVLLAGLYFFLARSLAEHGAHGLVSDDWTPVVEQAMFAFLLLFGFGGFGFLLDRQMEPIAAQGLPPRSGWLVETGLGIALGWGVALVCIVPLLFGGIALHFSFSVASFGWLAVDAVYFAVATLAVQIAFRGYAFQTAARVMGDLPAALLFAVLYAYLRAQLPGANRASMAVSVVLGLLLTLGYLRTRALWLPWGLHFGWVASRALLFGLPVNGVSSWFAFFALLASIPVLYRLTRDLDFVHNAPVLIPGGIPVDLDAAARLQHDAATRADVPEVKPLVQILPAAPLAPPPVAADIDRPRE